MKKKDWLFLLLLTFLILPAVLPLFRPGFFPSHDGEWMVVRLSDFHRSLVSGQFPVRWAARLNHQFGYPVFNFLYPLSLYMAEFFHLLGFDFVSAIKAVFILSFILSGWTMFFWLKGKWGPPARQPANWRGGLAALLAALVYVYTPYRLLDVYVRGSLGEALAFVFPPLLFWSLERLSQSFDRQALAIGAFALAGLIMAHNTLALLFLILFGFYSFYLFWRGKSSLIIIHSSLIILFGLFLSAFFWLPALYDKQFVIFTSAPVSNFFAHFPGLRQLVVPSWGYGPSLPLSDQDAMSFQVGLAGLVIAVMALFWQRRNFFIWAFWLVFFLMTPLSALVWRLLLFYNLVQFPWRLLALTTFCSTVLVGSLINQLGRWRQLFLLILVASFLIFQAKTYARPEYFIERPIEFYTTNEATTTVANEYTPKWVKELPLKRAEEKVEIIQGRGVVSGLKMNSKKLSFKVTLSEPGRIRVNNHYFPGWTLLVNAQKQAIDYQTNGLIEFTLPVGEQQLELVFQETPLRLTADIISLLSLLVATILFFKKVKNK